MASRNSVQHGSNCGFELYLLTRIKNSLGFIPSDASGGNDFYSESRSYLERHLTNGDRPNRSSLEVCSSLNSIYNYSTGRKQCSNANRDGAAGILASCNYFSISAFLRHFFWLFGLVSFLTPNRSRSDLV